MGPINESIFGLPSLLLVISIVYKDVKMSACERSLVIRFDVFD